MHIFTILAAQNMMIRAKNGEKLSLVTPRRPILLLILLLPAVAAYNGEDFSNSLFSDITP
jgi:hypothetical protein